MILGGHFDLENKQQRLINLAEEINDSNFWTSPDRETKLKEQSYLNNIVNKYQEYSNSINNNLELLNEEIDEELYELIIAEYNSLAKNVDKFRIETYLSGEYDKNDCILEIHSGAGGTEACDWAQMLYRMYTRYLTKNGYKYEEIDHQPGEEVGIKSILLSVKGLNAYGYLKGERGVHRLVRISPFDANKRRHTSFASVEVTPEFDDNIDVNIEEKDLRIDIYRSGGPGGQGVNTTDSAVRITHIPSGIVVACQTERSQIQNRATAMKMLKSRLIEIKEREHLDKIDDIKGAQMKIEWGSQIRSYVIMPYTLVKDHRTGFENGNIGAVMDGDLEGFINAYLKCAATGEWAK